MLRVASQLKSLKMRLLIVTICNTIISLCAVIVFFLILQYKTESGWNIFWKEFFPFLFIFFGLNAALNLFTTKVILNPINTLTREIKNLADSGSLNDLSAAHYPEMELLIKSIIDLVTFANKERAFALMLKEASRSRSKTAQVDSLTGLRTREYMDMFLPEEIARAGLLNVSLSILMLDVDDFKFYNDTNGHPEGDRALKQAAALLQNNTRNHDICIRYGGEEFMVIMPRTPLYQAKDVAERIRKAFFETHFDFEHKQPGGKLTISIGVATFPEHAAEHAALIKCADVALYQAKQKGKNMVCVFEPNPITQ
ncbi:MAG TPA: GGDEF domain-containing protein [Candidatus Sumerlaeia bacterium]|nr:MAG: Response regulator PleD [candidate division BRC1 bacterium ADurb.Bin183]HRS00862.1 GGDEF domain-containing protein [Candidatus Sumerlaeia bacterium]